MTLFNVGDSVGVNSGMASADGTTGGEPITGRVVRVYGDDPNNQMCDVSYSNGTSTSIPMNDLSPPG